MANDELIVTKKIYFTCKFPWEIFLILLTCTASIYLGTLDVLAHINSGSGFWQVVLSIIFFIFIVLNVSGGLINAIYGLLYRNSTTTENKLIYKHLVQYASVMYVLNIIFGCFIILAHLTINGKINPFFIHSHNHVEILAAWFWAPTLFLIGLILIEWGIWALGLLIASCCNLPEPDDKFVDLCNKTILLDVVTGITAIAVTYIFLQDQS